MVFQFWENFQKVDFKTTPLGQKFEIFKSCKKVVFNGKIESAVAELVGLDTENAKIGWILRFLWYYKIFKNFDFFS